MINSSTAFVSGVLDRYARLDQLSDTWIAALVDEGLVHIAEDIPTTITYRNYSRPGKRCSWNRKSGFSSTLVITEQRLIAIRRGSKILNLIFGTEYWRAVTVTLRDVNTLQIVGNASMFPNDQEGEVEYWFCTSAATQIFRDVTFRLNVNPIDDQRSPYSTSTQ